MVAPLGLNGKQVFITHMDDKESNQEKRDYSKEAAEYFSLKLEQYGNAEVPIKSLFGHRSQASSEIRHVSGQHAREFKEFLCKFNDIFVVIDDYVVLKSVLEKVGPNGEHLTIRRVEEEVTIDPYLMQQLVSHLETVVLTLCDKKENKSANCISLDSLFNYMVNNNQNELWSKMVSNTNDLATLLKMNSRSFCVQSTMVSFNPEREEQLRNSLSANNDHQAKLSNGTNATLFRSQSPSLTASTVSSPFRTSSAGSFQQRMRTQIMKAIAGNASSVYKNGCTANNLNGSSIDGAILRQTLLVTKSKEGEEIIDDIIKNGAVVAVDCEGVNLSGSGPITLIQVATMPTNSYSYPKIYIFDVLFNPEFLSNGLKRLLESDQVLKIFHDCRNDCSLLYFNHGIQVTNVFDPQVAHAVLQQQNHSKPVYKSKYISLSSLCEIYSNISLSPQKMLKKYYRRDQKYWTHRPLTEDMIYCAACNVYPLVPYIYINMTNLIRPEYYSLLEQLNKEAILSKISPNEVKASKKLRKGDMEVTDLKQKLYNADSKPIILSNREIRLLR